MYHSLAMAELSRVFSYFWLQPRPSVADPGPQPPLALQSVGDRLGYIRDCDWSAVTYVSKMVTLSLVRLKKRNMKWALVVEGCALLNPLGL